MTSTVQAQVLADKLYTADERRLALWSKRLVVLSVVAWLYGLFEGFDKALPILFVVGLALAIRGLKDPALGLMGVGILATIDAPARVYLLSGGLLRWNTFNYWLLIVIVLNVRFLLRLRDLQTRLLELFTLLLLLQFVVTPDFVNGAQHILGLVSVFGLLVYFVRALAAHEAVLEPVALVNGVVAAVGGLVFYTQIQDLPYINPNAFAHFPLMGLFSTAVLLELRKRQGPTGNLLYYLLLAINFAWVFLSGSRGGILIAATAVTLVWLGYRPLSPKGFVRSFLLLAIGLVLFLGLLSQFTDLQQRTIERFEKAFDTSLTLKSRTSGRSELMKGGIEIFKQHPLGVGTGAFTHYWTTLDAEKLGLLISTERELATHAGWIKVLAENGFLGITLLVLFTASFTIQGWYQRREGLFSIGLLTSAMLAVALISTEFQSKLLWFVSANAMVLLHRRQMIADWQDTVQHRPVDVLRPWSRNESQ